MLIYAVHTQPFDKKIMNYQEILNELSVLLASYSFYAYKEIMIYQERYFFGWVTIIIIALNVAMNISFMTYVSITSSLKKVKKL